MDQLYDHNDDVGVAPEISLRCHVKVKKMCVH